MRADELRQAVARIVEILVRADIRGAVDRYRTSRGDDRTAAAARLGHAGAVVMERFEGLGPAERLVVRAMHLHGLSDPSYWRNLTEPSSDPKAVAGELVRLTSRVVFATGQLPGLVSLLGGVDDAPRGPPAPAAGEARLVVRLVDAGERASDPDRVARSIDGVDMLYSACASIARKPAMDLRLERIDGADARDVHLTGERDAIGTVCAVLDSIPAAVADLDEDADVDLDDLVRSLPVFDDLATLGAAGAFPEADLRDIAETMHQGALLALESGVARVPVAAGGEAPVAAAPTAVVAVPAAASERASPSVPSRRGGPDDGGSREDMTNGSGGATAGSAETDPHYAQYLREREAMRRHPSGPDAPSDDRAKGSSEADGRSAVDDMLQSLGRVRGDR